MLSLFKIGVSRALKSLLFYYNLMLFQRRDVELLKRSMLFQRRDVELLKRSIIFQRSVVETVDAFSMKGC